MKAVHSRLPHVAGVLLTCGLAFGQATEARAASFSVNPTQIFLSASTRSALVTLRNETDQPVRFELSVMSWGQAPDGQMQLAPTGDVVFFPALLTLGAREERKIRVGVTVAPGAVEKTYRLFIEELPPLQTSATPGSVTMLTRMGIPIFLQPSKVTSQTSIQDLGVTGGRVVFRLQNAGTVHVIPQAVIVRGLDGSGKSVLEQRPTAWYLLAGGVRVFDLQLSAPQCEQARSVTVEVQFPGSTLKETLQTPGGACLK